MFIIDYTHPDGGYNVGNDNPPEPMLINPTNEDGTEFNPPKNPLLEKWFREYPSTKMPQYSQVCDGYSCMWCDRCPHGDGWKCPEEDKEVYEKWQKEYDKYCEEHGDLVFHISELFKEWYGKKYGGELDHGK